MEETATFSVGFVMATADGDAPEKRQHAGNRSQQALCCARRLVRRG